MKISPKELLKKVSYNSPVILTFAFISLFAVILGYITGNKSTDLLFCVYRGSLTDPLFYLRLFTHVIGHADLNHYLNNFLIILLVGPMLEEKYGSKNLLLMIVFTAFFTGIINLAFFETGLLGASGVAFMLILLSSFANFEKGTIPTTLILVAIIYIGNEILNGLMNTDNISQITHIIGGVCGGTFGYWINKNKH